MNNKIIIGIILIILACCGVYAAFGGIQPLGENNNVEISSPSIDTANLDASEKLNFTETETLDKKQFSTNESDVNAVLVNNNATVDIKNSAVNKSGDSNGGGDNTDFYGTNAAILVKKGSTANIENSIIYSNSDGSNAIFVTNAESDNMQSSENMQGQPGEIPPEDNNQLGEKPPEMPDEQGNSPDKNGGGEKPDAMPNGANNAEDYSAGGATANVKNVEINTYKDKSRGLDATYGGVINAENVIINTRGGSCAALATDRGEGTVNAENCVLNTGVDNGSGRGSPCIYSTGNITATNSKGTSYSSQIGCIEGKNSITLDNCDFNAFAGGNREENGQFVDLGAFFIYQSMSGDADVGTATLNATNSHFTIDSSSEHYKTAPMFHITNTRAIINLENCECNFGSGTLMNISGQNQWGTVGSNGGDLEFNIQNENLEGNIFVDKISSLTFNMKKSTFKGMINSEDYGNTSISIDEGSTWTLTGDSYVTSLENSGNIDYGNYTLYINGQAYTASNPYK